MCGLAECKTKDCNSHFFPFNDFCRIFSSGIFSEKETHLRQNSNLGCVLSPFVTFHIISFEAHVFVVRNVYDHLKGKANRQKE